MNICVYNSHTAYCITTERLTIYMRTQQDHKFTVIIFIVWPLSHNSTALHTHIIYNQQAIKKQQLQAIITCTTILFSSKYT